MIAPGRIAMEKRDWPRVFFRCLAASRPRRTLVLLGLCFVCFMIFSRRLLPERGNIHVDPLIQERHKQSSGSTFNRTKLRISPGVNYKNGTNLLHNTDDHIRTNATLIKEYHRVELHMNNSKSKPRTNHKAIHKGNGTCVQRLPGVLIIGVMKAGTDAFEHFLSVHPQVSINDLGVSLAFFTDRIYKKGLHWYRGQMPCSRPDQITVEKSPQYWSAKTVPERIQAMNASVQLILLVRNPIDRSVSDYLQGNTTTPGMFSTTFEKSVVDSRGQIISRARPIRQSIYYNSLQHWLKYFTLEQILIIDGDTFRIDPVYELNKVEQFLGIKHYMTTDKLIYNEDRKLYCMRYQHCLSKGKGRVHPDIGPELKAKLVAFFEPYNELFYKLVGRRFNW